MVDGSYDVAVKFDMQLMDQEPKSANPYSHEIRPVVRRTDWSARWPQQVFYLQGIHTDQPFTFYKVAGHGILIAGGLQPSRLVKVVTWVPDHIIYKQ
jgi:hypothetical protein